ncbi:hypothetical protein DYQ86_24820 [Acidobacteria bacterium AB60]|nr:hypothetical protein DYQ86_24820 [Acidobacteria bacterium AB60]
MPIHAWFTALGDSPLGHAMQTSKWDFALVEMVHLLALAILGGAVLITDLRLLGVILKDTSHRLVGRDLGRLVLGSLTVMVITGIALLSEEAGKCYYSPAFRLKMAFLLAALLFHTTLHRWALVRSDKHGPSIWSRSAALMSMGLWLGVGIGGRAIGLL